MHIYGLKCPNRFLLKKSPIKCPYCNTANQVPSIQYGVLSLAVSQYLRIAIHCCIPTPKKVEAKKAGVTKSPQPGPLYYHVSDSKRDDSADSSDDYNNDPRSLCCVCHQNHPEKLNLEFNIEFAQWGQCETCSHWTHLEYCSTVRFLRRDYIFYCPHCRPSTAIYQE